MSSLWILKIKKYFNKKIKITNSNFFVNKNPWKRDLLDFVAIFEKCV